MRNEVWRTAVVFEAGLGLLAIVLGWLLGVRPAPWAQIDWSVLGVGQGLLAAAPMLVGLVLLTWHPIGPFRSIDAFVRQWVVPLFRECTIWQLLAISALAGLGEELLFRAVAQQGIEQATGSFAVALVAASVLFGLGHAMTASYAVLAGVIGAYLGLLLHASGNLLAPIVAHGAYDFLALVWLVRREGRSAHESDVAQRGTVPFSSGSTGKLGQSPPGTSAQ